MLALDPPNALLVAETIFRLCASRGLSTVALTYRSELVRRLCGRLLNLVEGRIERARRSTPPLALVRPSLGFERDPPIGSVRRRGGGEHERDDL